MSKRPLAIDLFCGLGGWSDGLLAANYDVVGFDIERHEYGEHSYPGTLVIQDVLTLHGAQFRDAALIVASPPCQEYSYMAMPWSRAKAIAAEYRSGVRDTKQLTALFDACFRIQREACEAAGRHIPLVVENVRGAIPWVGRSRWNFGSYHLWGDVPALMPLIKVSKSSGMNWSNRELRGQDFTRVAGQQANEGRKHHGDWFRDPTCPTRQGGQTKRPADGRKGAGAEWFDQNLCQLPSASPRRKEASALIAKIPLPLSRHIAAVFRP